jgi:transposase
VFAIVCNRIHAEDPGAQILSAWIARGELRSSLATARVGGVVHLARHPLHRFLTCVSPHRCPTAHRAATIDTWWPKTNAFITTGITNAPHRALQLATRNG